MKKAKQARKYQEGQIVMKGDLQFKVVDGCLHRYEAPLCEAEGKAARRFEEMGCTKGFGKKNGAFRKGQEARERRMLKRMLTKSGLVRAS